MQQATRFSPRNRVRPGEKPLSTYSIVAYDPETGDLGIGVQSAFLAVGAVAPFAAAGVGAIATQSYANTTYGPHGLALLKEDVPVQQIVKRLTEDDDRADFRQLGIVNARGEAAAFTGDGCHEWAGHIVGENFACQGNILVDEKTVQAMADSFTSSTGPLTRRLVAALAAAQEAGGDRRGQQSAALLVVREGAGYGGFDDKYCDLRVDDHPKPVDELERLLTVFEELQKLLAAGEYSVD